MGQIRSNYKENWPFSKPTFYVKTGQRGKLKNNFCSEGIIIQLEDKIVPGLQKLTLSE